MNLAAEARSKQLWDHTATLMAWIQNQNPYRRSDADPLELHPMRRDEKKHTQTRLKPSRALKAMAGR